MLAAGNSATVVLLIALSACGAPLHSTGKPSHSASSGNDEDAQRADFRRRAAQIKIGMTRREVDRLLVAHDGGLSGLETSRYCQPPGIKADVTFTLAAPGRIGPGDTVVAPVRVYVERCWMD
jgi:hypothetical protein